MREFFLFIRGRNPAGRFQPCENYRNLLIGGIIRVFPVENETGGEVD